MLWWTLAEHVYANPDSTHMFYFSHLYQNRGHQIYLDLRGIDTSRVTSMHGMFFQDSTNLDYITGIDLSEFNTSNVTTMYGMFDGPSNISSLNLSTFDTSKVTDMSHMFRHKQNISNLNLSNFDTSRVTSLARKRSKHRNITTHIQSISHYTILWLKIDINVRFILI